MLASRGGIDVKILPIVRGLTIRDITLDGAAPPHEPRLAEIKIAAKQPNRSMVCIPHVAGRLQIVGAGQWPWPSRLRRLDILGTGTFGTFAFGECHTLTFLELVELLRL